MHSDLENILLIIPAILIFIAFQIILYRISNSLIISYLISFIIGEFSLLLLIFNLFHSHFHLLEVISSSINYFFTTFFYFTILGIVISSIRVKLLSEIYTSKLKINKEYLIEKYSAKKLIDSRLERHIQLEDIFLSEGKYYLNPQNKRLIYILNIINFLKKIFKTNE